MQKEERKKSVNKKFQNLDQAFMAKGKQPYKENTWVLCQGGVSSNTDTNVKKNGTCNYRDKFGHYVYECRKKKFSEPKYKR